jgi:D-alanyl-D-alanine carboxypeptidase (penicillin-binding protein 5/6)
MTAYVIFGMIRDRQLDPAQPVQVSQKAWKAQGSRMFIEPRTPATVEDLLKGLIVQSGNDAAIALAEAGAGSEEAFVQLMNRQAEKMGLANTHFENASGAPAQNHHASARDLAQVALAIIRDFPDQYPRYSQKEFVYNRIKQTNRNRLLWIDPAVDGMKTGFTEAAGYCLIASSKRGERRLVSVVLGTQSEQLRTSESQKLLNFGFQAYDTVQLYQSGKPVAALKVWKGAEREVGAGFLADRYLTLPRGRAGDLKLTLEALEPLVAPVARGQHVGVVKISLDGGQVAAFPLIALDDVPPANLFVRAWDTVRLWFK